MFVYLNDVHYKTKIIFLDIKIFYTEHISLKSRYILCIFGVIFVCVHAHAWVFDFQISSIVGFSIYFNSISNF